MSRGGHTLVHVGNTYTLAYLLYMKVSRYRGIEIVGTSYIYKKYSCLSFLQLLDDSNDSEFYLIPGPPMG